MYSTLLQHIGNPFTWVTLSGFFLVGLLIFRNKLARVYNDFKQTNQVLIEKQSHILKELEICRQENQKLKQELEFRNKELTTQTLNLLQKNALMEEVRELVNDFLQNNNLNQSNSTISYSRLNNLIDYSFTLDKEWEDFKLCFERVHEDFFLKLKENFPELTAGELKLCALIKLNLNMKEAATILGISPESVKTARYRLRKKLNLVEEKNLSDFLLTV